MSEHVTCMRPGWVAQRSMTDQMVLVGWLRCL